MNPPVELKLPTAEDVANIAIQAGKLTLEYFRKSLTVTEKSHDQGIVTDADLASEKLIKDLIQKTFPEHSILGEESGLTNKSSFDNGPRPLWLVDPVDGTTNFSKGNPYYCVSIGFALQTGPQSCQMYAAAIHHPASGDIYAAEQGKGSFCNGQRMKISTETTLRLASFATGFSSNKGKDLDSVAESIRLMQNECLGMRINGAAALDLALCSRGVFQGFFEKQLMPWDTAAGSLIVKEAGGVVTNFEGQEFDPLRDKNIIATNNHLYEKVLGVVQTCFKS